MRGLLCGSERTGVQATGATSLNAIADALNARGIPTARGKAWTSVQVLNLKRHLAH
jgi:hypothetical protein